MFAGKTFVAVDHGQLEAIYRPAREDAERVALVLHPHPLYGGTMHNPVVFHCAKALEAAGFETLRINFRGVGESTGRWDEGRGEADDAAAALEFLLASQPAAKRVVVAGFSFGAGIGLRVGCVDPRVTAIVAIAAPTTLLDAALLRSCGKPKLFVHGSEDDVAPLAPLRRLLEDAAPPVALRIVEGAGHFFDTGRDMLVEHVRSFAAGESPGEPS